ncbi:MAG: hypothetical protein Dbin4_01079, partial [Alphaproteobacteria bacterium]|nr:hypothetical protein [Alphaproteobacteria bacterium]
MATFDEREKGFERKFALDAELEFKAMARRNKLLGLWAAEKMGITGADAGLCAAAGGRCGRLQKSHCRAEPFR